MNNQGLTLIELLLVISIISIVAVSTTPFVSSTLLRFQGTSTQDRLLGAIRKAQTYSMDHRLGEQWGICITSGKLRLYANNCSGPTRFEDWTIPSNISITGFTDLTFSIYRGEPNSTPAISVTTGVTTHQVTLNSIGGLNVN